MGLTALGLIQARKLARGDPRQSLALMTAAFGLGQMIGPSFAGFAYHFTGSFRAPSLAAAAGAGDRGGAGRACRLRRHRF